MNVQSLDRRTDPTPYFDTIEAFFDWSDRREEKYELVDGVPHLLPNVRLNHMRVVVDLTALLAEQLDMDEFEPTIGDFAVEVGPRSVRYADIMIIPAGKPGRSLRTSDAVVLFEVLSDSTMHVDFGAKLGEYQRLDSLSTYLILDQNQPRVWRWSRQDDGKWPNEPAILTEGTIELKRPTLSLPLERIYARIRPDS